VVQGVHGRDANTDAADFSDGKPDHHAALGFGLWRIEASVLNTLEEGDEGIVAVNGVFSERMYEIATRASSRVVKVEAPYGKPVDAEDVRRAGKGKKIRIIGFAHGETSTGVITGIDAYRKVADELGALLIVDTVASLAAVPIDVNKQRIDICFSGSQKAISAPRECRRLR